MQLLDLIVPGQPRHPRIYPHRVGDKIKDAGDKVNDSISQLKDSVADTISVAKDSISAGKDCIADSLSAASPLQGGANSGDDASMLLWAIVAVAAVLAICLWFALSYRRRLGPAH